MAQVFYQNIGEVTCLLVSLVMLYLIYATMPRETKGYKYIIWGNILSILHILLVIFISQFHSVVPENHMLFFKNGVFICYGIYIAILLIIMTFVFRMPVERRTFSQCRPFIIFSSVYLAIYLVIVLWLLIGNYMYISVNGVVTATMYARTDVNFAILTYLFCLAMIIYNRKMLARPVAHLFTGVSIGALMLLGLQIVIIDTVFISFTYVIPFFMMYILFHSEPYDDSTQLQPGHSFNTHFNRAVKSKKPFHVTIISFPRIKDIVDADILNALDIHSIKTLRKVENMGRGITGYAISESTFGVIYTGKGEKDFEKNKPVIEELVQNAIAKWSFTTLPEYHMIHLEGQNGLSFARSNLMLKYLMEQMHKDGTISYTVSEKDYEMEEQMYEIFESIVDIRNRGNLDDERIVVYAQPIMNVDAGEFRTAEALVRLNLHGKMVPPYLFIPIAEKNECIGVLTKIILNKVCKEIKKLEETNEFEAISVNCSAIDFTDTNMHRNLMSIILANDVDPSKVYLEMTESAMMEGMEVVEDNMERFKDSGVSFYLDDFGTGYSNLERIVTLPFSTIKFDKSLLYKSLENEALNQLVRSMVKVFRNHGLRVLIEGVEDDSQADYCKKIGFQYIQGYKYAKPVPIEELKDYFKKK